MPPKSGIFGNVSNLLYIDSEQVSHFAVFRPLLPCFKYKPLPSRNLTPSSSVFTAEAKFALFLSSDSTDAKGNSKAIPSPAGPPPAVMSSSASPSTAPSAEYAEVSSHRLDLFSSHEIVFPFPHLVFFFSIPLDLQHLSNLVVIPSLSHENHYFLGAIGNLDPTNFIISETNNIPFRLANSNLGHWKNTFKSWPSLEKTSPEKSWAVWFKRVSASKQAHWDKIESARHSPSL